MDEKIKYKTVLGMKFFLVYAFTFSLLYLGSTQMESITGMAITGTNTSDGFVPSSTHAPAENATEQDAYIALQNAKKDIQELQQIGIISLYLGDRFEEAERYYEGENISELLILAKALNNTDQRYKAYKLFGQIKESLKNGTDIGSDYTKVIELTGEINQRKVWALTLYDEFWLLDERISQANSSVIDLTLVYERYEEAKTAFVEDRYEETEDLIMQTYRELDIAQIDASRYTALLKASQRNIIYFVKTNWIVVLLVISILTLAGYICYNEYMITRLKHTITDLSKEKQLMVELTKKAQEDHYVKGRLSKNIYTIKLRKYKDRALEISSLLPVLKNKLSGKFTIRSSYSRYLKGIFNKDKKDPDNDR